MRQGGYFIFGSIDEQTFFKGRFERENGTITPKNVELCPLFKNSLESVFSSVCGQRFAP